MIRLFKVAMAEDAPDRVAEVLRSGYIGEGPKVAEFERKLTNYVGAPVITTNSGTSAIWLALDLAGVEPGVTVMASPMTCLLSNLPLLHREAEIEWADVDKETGNILIDETDRIGETSDATVILFTDYGGVPANLEDLQDFSRCYETYRTFVIEDACQALGATYEGHPVGRWVDFTCFSFQAIKHLTTGDGGAIAFWSERARAKLEEARLKRWAGLDRSKGGFRADQTVTSVGYKFQMNDIAAAIGLANFPLLGRNLAGARFNADFYDKHLADIPGVLLPGRPINSNPSWWLYNLRVDDRAAFVKGMAERGVECGRPHSRNDLHPIFARFRRELPGVEYYDAHHVAIPVGWWLSERDRAKVVQAVKEVVSG